VEQVEQVEAGLQNYVEQVEQEQGGLQIPWKKWNKDKGSVQLNLSTWPNVELQDRVNFTDLWRRIPARVLPIPAPNLREGIPLPILVRGFNPPYQIFSNCIWCGESARPYASCKIFKGWSRRNAFSKLLHRQYQSFRYDGFCQFEIKNPTTLSNKTINAWFCAKDQFLEN